MTKINDWNRKWRLTWTPRKLLIVSNGQDSLKPSLYLPPKTPHTQTHTHAKSEKKLWCWASAVDLLSGEQAACLGSPSMWRTWRRRHLLRRCCHLDSWGRLIPAVSTSTPPISWGAAASATAAWRPVAIYICIGNSSFSPSLRFFHLHLSAAAAVTAHT